MLSKEEIAELVRAHGWRRPEDVAKSARADRAESPALYNTILRMGRRELQTLVEWIWQLEGEELYPEIDRIAKLKDVAANGRCTCDGKWTAAAERLLAIQQLDSVEFRKLVARALRIGRAKSMNVLISAASGSACSLLNSFRVRRWCCAVGL